MFSLIKASLQTGTREEINWRGISAGVCARGREGGEGQKDAGDFAGNSFSFLCFCAKNDRGILLVSLPCGPDCIVTKSGLIPPL